jgi:hypothetical protein
MRASVKRMPPTATIPARKRSEQVSVEASMAGPSSQAISAEMNCTERDTRAPRSAIEPRARNGAPDGLPRTVPVICAPIRLSSGSWGISREPT